MILSWPGEAVKKSYSEKMAIFLLKEKGHAVAAWPMQTKQLRDGDIDLRAMHQSAGHRNDGEGVGAGLGVARTAASSTATATASSAA